MRTTKIVADSSANIRTLQHTDFAVAPLKVLAGRREFVDDATLDVEKMITWFAGHKGKSHTSCPNPEDYLQAFGDADDIFCVTITSGLSGSWNAATIAAEMYTTAHPERRVHVIDSLSAGPELALLIEKLESCITEQMPYEDICREIDQYQTQTGLLFMLESLKNFAANGRVSPAVAKIAGVLGIRIVGRASVQGTLEPMHKCRGEHKALQTIVNELRAAGLSQGKVRIAHCQNEAAAQTLQQMLLQQIGPLDVQIHPCLGLCSYYAEKGGLLVGFEKQ